MLENVWEAAGPVEEVHVSSRVLQVCWAHALSNEKEEIMGLLVGSVKGTTVKFATLKTLKRTTREKDRVEIAPNQLVKGADFADSLKDENGQSLRVLGWYHSHPHITVHPSAVDLRTQASYQMLDSSFIGLIFSVFDFNVRSIVDKREMIAFQANTSEMPPVCKYVPFIVDDDVSMITKEVFVSTFDALMEMWELMAEEYKEEFDEVKSRNFFDLVAQANNDSQYTQSLAQLLQFHINPAINAAKVLINMAKMSEEVDEMDAMDAQEEEDGLDGREDVDGLGPLEEAKDGKHTQSSRESSPGLMIETGSQEF